MNKLSIKKMNGLTEKKKKGFTLVELIIVIAIIAILAAIAIPKFGTIKSDANKKTDIATAKTIATLVSKAIASDTLTDDLSTKTSIASLPKKGSNPATTFSIKDELDGKAVATSGNNFYVKIVSGNVEVYDGDTTTEKLFPQS